MMELSFGRWQFLLLIIIGILFVCSPVLSVDTPPARDADPGSYDDILKVAETSSPRDTLLHFIKDAEVTIRHTDSTTGLLDEVGYRAYSRIISMLDFTTTPGGSSRVVIAERLAMLYDVLSKIDLPEPEAIPDKELVESGEINQWTIPNTAISIKRTEAGPRKGAFLFSPQTVLYLPSYYRQLTKLESRPGFIPDVYNKLLADRDARMNQGYLIRKRLKPIDNSSPQALLQSFMKNVNEAYALVMETDKALKQKPPVISLEEAKQAEIVANNLLETAMMSLDLTRVPKNIRDDIGIESVLLLKEIIDRITLPPLEMIPDLGDIIFQREHAAGKIQGGIRWNIPDTPIEVIEIVKGVNAGSFNISSDSVEKLPKLYEKIKDLPYRNDYSNISNEYVSPGLSKGFYDYYISTPGNLIPGTTALGRAVDKLPSWTKEIHFGQTLWQYCILLVSLMVGGALLFLGRRIVMGNSSDFSPAGRFWRRAMLNVLIILVALILLDFLDNEVNLSGALLSLVDASLSAVYWAMTATLIFFIGMAVAEWIVGSPRIDPEGVQASYIRAIIGVISFISMIAVFVYGLAQIGVALGPLLASLGIGGLAVALAVRPTLENVIGSFMIFIDKPFRVGQRVNVMGQNGTIESIGLRSTKIRLLTGTLTSIPNKKLVDVEVENIGRRNHIRRNFNVNITYDTPPEKIVRAIDIIKEILSVPDSEAGNQSADAPHPNTAINYDEYPPRVYFNDMLADSLNIVVFYWYHPGEYWGFLEHSNWVNLQIIEQFNKEGIDFAFPTQTLHLAGDEKRPLTVGQKWESSEETFSPSTILAQASALGAQAVLSHSSRASDTMRPEPPNPSETIKTKVEGELTNAPLEDDLLCGEDGGDQR